MSEPDWGQLPFRTRPDEWRTYDPQPPAVVSPGDPLVLIHYQAAADFARRIGIDDPVAACQIMGGGVVGWRRSGQGGRRPGGRATVYAIDFRGAQGVKYHVADGGDVLWLYRPEEVGNNRDEHSASDPADDDGRSVRPDGRRPPGRRPGRLPPGKRPDRRPANRLIRRDELG